MNMNIFLSERERLLSFMKCLGTEDRGESSGRSRGKFRMAVGKILDGHEKKSRKTTGKFQMVVREKSCVRHHFSAYWNYRE